MKRLSTNQSFDAVRAPDHEATEQVVEGESEDVQDQDEDEASDTGAFVFEA